MNKTYNKEMQERRKKMKKERSRKKRRYLCKLVFCEISQVILVMLLFMLPACLTVICGFIMELFPNFF